MTGVQTCALPISRDSRLDTGLLRHELTEAYGRDLIGTPVALAAEGGVEDGNMSASALHGLAGWSQGAELGWLPAVIAPSNDALDPQALISDIAAANGNQANLSAVILTQQPSHAPPVKGITESEQVLLESILINSPDIVLSLTEVPNVLDGVIFYAEHAKDATVRTNALNVLAGYIGLENADITQALSDTSKKALIDVYFSTSDNKKHVLSALKEIARSSDSTSQFAQNFVWFDTTVKDIGDFNTEINSAKEAQELTGMVTVAYNQATGTKTEMLRYLDRVDAICRTLNGQRAAEYSASFQGQSAESQIRNDLTDFENRALTQIGVLKNSLNQYTRTAFNTTDADKVPEVILSLYADLSRLETALLNSLKDKIGRAHV